MGNDNDETRIDLKEMLFDDNFTIAMFYIIKFLAERRNNKKDNEFHFMNMYPTIKEELGVFHMLDEPIHKTEEQVKKERETMANEDKMFKEMNINYSADHDIVAITEKLREIILKNNS